MTVKLLQDYGKQPAGSKYTSDSLTEAAMVAGGLATASLTGATDWPPATQPGGAPVSFSATESAALKALVTGGGISADMADPSAGQPSATRQGASIGYRSNSMTVVASGGFLTGNAGSGTRAWYADRYMPNGCKRQAFEFKFTAGSGGRNGCAVLALGTSSVTASANVPAMLVHFTITRWAWAVGTSPAVNGTITNYASGRFNTALAANTVYTAEFSVDGGKLYIRLPDGTTAIATNAALTSMSGTYPFHEVYQFDGTSDDLAQIGRVWYSDADQGAEGAPAWSAAQLDIPRRPTALQLTSLTSSAIAASAAIIDSAAICPVYSGPSGAANVICRFTGWVNLAAGRSLILAPRFVDIDGGVVTQPYMFGYTASAGSAYSGPFAVEMVQNVASSKPVNCQLWANSFGPGDSSGDSFGVAANKPITMQFIPLG